MFLHCNDVRLFPSDSKLKAPLTFLSFFCAAFNSLAISFFLAKACCFTAFKRAILVDSEIPASSGNAWAVQKSCQFQVQGRVFQSMQSRRFEARRARQQKEDPTEPRSSTTINRGGEGKGRRRGTTQTNQKNKERNRGSEKEKRAPQDNDTINRQHKKGDQGQGQGAILTMCHPDRWHEGTKKDKWRSLTTSQTWKQAKRRSHKSSQQSCCQETEGRRHSERETSESGGGTDGEEGEYRHSEQCVVLVKSFIILYCWSSFLVLQRFAAGQLFWI